MTVMGVTAGKKIIHNPLDDHYPMTIIHDIPPHREGRIAIVTFAGRGAVDAAAFGAAGRVRAACSAGVP